MQYSLSKYVFFRVRNAGLFAALLLSVFSCIDREKEVEINLPFEGARMVLFGLLTPDDPVLIQVTRTVGLRNLGDTAYVANAQVILFENDIAADTLHYASDGWYISKKDFRVKEGLAYYVRASAPDLPAVVSIPEAVPEKVYLLEADVQGSNQRGTRRTLYFTFFDPPKKNYYFFTYDFQWSGSIDTLSLKSKANSFNYYDFLSDHSLNGDRPTVIKTIFISSIKIGNAFMRSDKLRFSFYNITPAFYRHLESILEYYDFNDFDGQVPFDAPTTNVRGGYGYVGVAARDVVWLDVR